jgi:tRNA pseudouridine38-40 synthase
MLPAEVRVLDIAVAAPSFHARYSARSKTYRYQIVNGPLASPFEWRYCWHIQRFLDFDAMASAASLFAGEHDFGAFRAAGGSVGTARRLVFASRMLRIDGGGPLTWLPGSGGAPAVRLVYEVTANGFLRHMVRAIAGTLVEVGFGRRDAASVVRALESGDRRDAGATAPARGLWLVAVDYQAFAGYHHHLLSVGSEGSA